MIQPYSDYPSQFDHHSDLIRSLFLLNPITLGVAIYWLLHIYVSFQGDVIG